MISVNRNSLYIREDFICGEAVIGSIFKLLDRNTVFICEKRNKYVGDLIVDLCFCFVENNFKSFVSDVAYFLVCLVFNCSLKSSLICCIKISYNVAKSQCDIIICINLLINLARNCWFIFCFCGIDYTVKKCAVFGFICYELTKLGKTVGVPIISYLDLSSVIECIAILYGINYVVLRALAYYVGIFPNCFPIRSCKGTKMRFDCVKRLSLTVRTDLILYIGNRLAVKIVFSLYLCASANFYNLVNNCVSDFSVNILPNTGVSRKVVAVSLFVPILIINERGTFREKLIFNFCNDG